MKIALFALTSALLAVLGTGTAVLGEDAYRSTERPDIEKPLPPGGHVDLKIQALLWQTRTVVVCSPQGDVTAAEVGDLFSRYWPRDQIKVIDAYSISAPPEGPHFYIYQLDPNRDLARADCSENLPIKRETISEKIRSMSSHLEVLKKINAKNGFKMNDIPLGKYIPPGSIHSQNIDIHGSVVKLMFTTIGKEEILLYLLRAIDGFTGECHIHECFGILVPPRDRARR